MLILKMILAFCLGSYVGKWVANVALFLPLILLDENHEKEPKDLARQFFKNSQCWSCQHSITWYEQLPIFGYFWTNGICRYCNQWLGYKCIIIEIGIGLFFGLTALWFPIGPTFIFLLLVGCLLVCCFLTDFIYAVLPDQLTLSLLWVGLMGSLHPVFVNSEEAIIGAFGGYAIFWAFNEIYRYLRHQEGMYPGDFKLNAAIGACVGFKWLLTIMGGTMALLILTSFFQLLVYKKMTLKNYLQKEVPYGCYASLVGLGAIIFLAFKSLH